jgi:hypothetical protein
MRQSDTQALYRLVQDLRTLVNAERAEAIDARDQLAPHHAVFSQSAANESRWQCAQDTLAAAAEAERAATCALATVRGAPEPHAERAYRDARVELERAFFEFRQAHRELSVLVAIYLRAAAR